MSYGLPIIYVYIRKNREHQSYTEMEPCHSEFCPSIIVKILGLYGESE